MEAAYLVSRSRNLGSGAVFTLRSSEERDEISQRSQIFKRFPLAAAWKIKVAGNFWRTQERLNRCKNDGCLEILMKPISSTID